MIIKNINIRNFRSYYGENSFDFSSGLTLIIGDNGDGKTTFTNLNATVNAQGKVTSYKADVDTDAAYTGDTEVIQGGVFKESVYRSAPYFDIRIDGITEL